MMCILGGMSQGIDVPPGLLPTADSVRFAFFLSPFNPVVSKLQVPNTKFWNYIADCILLYFQRRRRIFLGVLCVAVQFCNRNPRKSIQISPTIACKTPKFSPSGGLKWEGKTDKKNSNFFFAP